VARFRETACEHGDWLPWLEAEFGWTDRTARRFMDVARLPGKMDNLSDLDIPVSSLYLLASPELSQVCQELLERAALI
jgi:hypothetical protein